MAPPAMRCYASSPCVLALGTGRDADPRRRQGQIVVLQVAAELVRNEPMILGTEPWLYLQYGVVTLKASGAGSPAMQQFRECLREAEREVGREGEALQARWVGRVSGARSARSA